MNQLFDKEGAIERYLNGTMPPAERTEFMSRMERDADLRRSVDTELLIGKAIRGDRSEIPPQPPESRARFLAMLATVAPEPSSMPGAESAPQMPAPAAGGAEGSSFMKALSGGGFTKGVVATLTGVAVTIGAMLYNSDAPQQPETGIASPAVTAPASVAPASVDGRPLPGETTPAEAASAATQRQHPASTGTTAGTTAAIRPATAETPRLKPARSTSVPAERTADASNETKLSTPSDKARESNSNQSRSPQVQKNTPDIPATRNDSLTIRVKPTLPRINN